MKKYFLYILAFFYALIGFGQSKNRAQDSIYNSFVSPPNAQNRVFGGWRKDIAYQNSKNVLAMFDKYGIKYVTNDYPAGHTFITWRHNLLEFAPLLFK